MQEGVLDVALPGALGAHARPDGHHAAAQAPAQGHQVRGHPRRARRRTSSPVRPMPDWTSSKTSTAPYLSQSSRAAHNGPQFFLLQSEHRQHFRDRLVFDIAGDGSIQMNIQELATAVLNKPPVKSGYIEQSVSRHGQAVAGTV